MDFFLKMIHIVSCIQNKQPINKPGIEIFLRTGKMIILLMGFITLLYTALTSNASHYQKRAELS